VPKDVSGKDRDLLKELKKSSDICPNHGDENHEKSIFEKAKDIFS